MTTATVTDWKRKLPADALDERRAAVPWVGASTTADRDRYLAEDSVAWRSVCGVLVSVVAVGALGMAILVAVILIAS